MQGSIEDPEAKAEISQLVDQLVQLVTIRAVVEQSYAQIIELELYQTRCFAREELLHHNQQQRRSLRH